MEVNVWPGRTSYEYADLACRTNEGEPWTTRVHFGKQQPHVGAGAPIRVPAETGVVRVQCRADVKTGHGIANLHFNEYFVIGGTPAAPAPAPPAAPPAAPIRLAEAEVVAMRISAWDSAPPWPREYAVSFDRAAIRQIAAEIVFNAPATGQVEGAVVCRWRFPSGAVNEYPARNVAQRPGTEQLVVSSTAGYDRPGQWPPGRYRVTCDADGQVRASQSFEVVEPTGGQPVTIVDLTFWNAGPAEAGQAVRRTSENTGTHFPPGVQVGIGFSLTWPTAQETGTASYSCDVNEPSGDVRHYRETATVNRGSTGVSWTWLATVRGTLEPGRYEVNCEQEGRRLASSVFHIGAPAP
jgi:hypothetical protein